MGILSVKWHDVENGIVLVDQINSELKRDLDP